MKNLRDGVEEKTYLALRRGLGFKLKETRSLREGIRSCDVKQRGETRITTRFAIEWATDPQQLHPSEWAARLSGVRAFARYWSTIDTTTEIHPEGLLPFRPGRANPYLYTDQEIRQLLNAAESMPAQFALHRPTHHCLLGLLAVSGMRISEALNLELRDIDWVEALLTIRSTKFGKSRLVPLHPTAKMVLSDYVSPRNECFSDRPLPPPFFPSKTGARLDEGQVRRVFYRLSRQVGIRGASASRGPRLHDFRHRFAVETLLRWYRSGEDVTRRLPVLSTYLGHPHIYRHLIGI